MMALIAVCAVAPVLNLWVPEGSVFHMSTYAVALLGKIMCYAICALAMDLIWGYTGILSLGHGVFFALGGYTMGMYLMRQIGRDGNYKSDLPDFMVFLDWKTLPWHWTFSVITKLPLWFTVPPMTQTAGALKPCFSTSPAMVSRVPVNVCWRPVVPQRTSAAS